MINSWESDSCEEVRAYYSSYYVPQAAALWCGVPSESVDLILNQSVENGINILKHQKIPCLEPRCRAIHDAIDNNKIPCGRDGRGRKYESEDHVALPRRTVSRQDLKEWIAKEFPSDKPDFLFDEIERNTHAAINVESFRALQADRDALKRQLETAKKEYNDAVIEKYEIAARLKQLEERQKSLGNEIDPRSEKTYLNIIGALLEVTAGTFKDEVFSSETKLREFLSEKFDGFRGVTERTLAEKFALAKKSINGESD